MPRISRDYRDYLDGRGPRKHEPRDMSMFFVGVRLVLSSVCAVIVFLEHGTVIRVAVVVAWVALAALVLVALVRSRRTSPRRGPR